VSNAHTKEESEGKDDSADHERPFYK